MPAPVRLDFQGSAAGAKRAGEQSVTAIRAVRDQALKANADIMESARAAIRSNLAQRDSIAENAAAYRKLAQTYVKGSREYMEAMRLARAEHAKLGTTAKETAAVVVEQEKVKQTAIARTTEFLMLQAKAMLAPAKAGREAAGLGAVGAAEHRAEARGVRGAIGEGTRELGFGRILGGPALVGGFVAAAGLAESIKLTLQAQQGQAQLRNALTNTGVSWSKYKDRINETLEAQMKLSGFDKNDLRDALTSLIRRTGDVDKATRGLGLATNLARGAHIDIGRAVTIVTRAYQGNVGQLARLGIQVPKVTEHMDRLRNAHIKVTDANRAQVTALMHTAKQLDAQATSVKAVDEIERKYHNAALTRSKTLSGQIDALKNRFREWGVEVGTRAIPYATRFFEWINKTIDAIGRQHRALSIIKQTLSAFVGGISTIVDGLRKFWGSLTDGQKTLVKVGGGIVALTALMASNPFLALATGLIIAIGLIRKHWEAFSTWIKKRAYQIVLDIVEPFSHLPGSLGHWARKAKESMQENLWSLEHADAAAAAQDAADTFGKTLLDGMAPWLKAANQNIAGALQGSGTAAGGGTVPKGKTVQGSGGGPANYAVRAAAMPNANTVGFSVPFEAVPHDCSAFVQAVFKNSAGIDIGRDTYAQFGHGTSIQKKDLVPNDVIFMNFPGERSPGHVGIYVGGGMMVHDRGAHGGVVQMPVPWGNVVGYRRYIKADIPKDTGGGGGDGAGDHHAPPSAADTTAADNAAFDAAIAKADKAGDAAKKKRHHKGPAGLAGATITSIGEIVTSTIERVNKQISDAGMKVTPGEKALEARLQALRDLLKKGMSREEVAKIKAQMTEVTHHLTAEVGDRIKQHRKEEAAAKKARAAFNKTLTPIDTFAGGLLTASRTDSNSDLTSSISSSVSGLQGLGQRIDRAAQNAVAQIQKLRDRLATLKNRPGDASIRDKIRDEIRQWGNSLNQELQRQLTKAQQIQETRSRALDRFWRDTVTSAQRTFDATTAAWEKQFDRDTQAHLASMQKDLQQRIASTAAFVQTAYGSFSIMPGGQTPAEKALADLQAANQTSDLGNALQDAQDALNRANIIGDPGEIKDAQRAVAQAQEQIDEARLSQQATDERTAADKALSDLNDQLTAEEALKEQAYQDDRDATRQAYEQARADQWQHIQDELDDWHTMIDEKQKSYAEFLTWYANQNLGSLPDVPVSAAAAADAEAHVAAYTAAGWSTGKIGRAGIGTLEFQTGAYATQPTPGIVASHESEFVVPESWLTPDLREQLMNILYARRAPGARPARGSMMSTEAGGGGGGQGTMIYAPVHVAGSVTTERDLALTIRDHIVDVGRATGGSMFGGQA